MDERKNTSNSFVLDFIRFLASDGGSGRERGRGGEEKEGGRERKGYSCG